MSTEETVGNSLVHAICGLFDTVERGNFADTPWLQVWEKVLQLEGAPDLGMYEALSLIGASIDRLKQQFKQSQSVSDRAKGLVIPIIDAMRACVAPKALGLRWNNYASHIARHNRDILAVAGDQLEKEFPEPRLTKKDFTEMQALAESMIAALDDEAFPKGLAAVLRPHVEAIQWTLGVYHLIGIDGLFRAWMINVEKIRRVRPDDDEDGPDNPTKKTWLERILGPLKRMGEVIDRADKAVRLGERGYRLYDQYGGDIGRLLS